MLILSSWLLFAGLIDVAQARGITSTSGAACLNVANNFTNFPFDCQQPDLAYRCRCADKSFLGTVINCIENYSEDSQDLAGAYKYLLDTCSSQGHKNYRMVHVARIYDNASEYLIPMSQIDKSGILRNPVVISQSAYDISFKSASTLLKERNDSTYMGWSLYGYWCVIFIIATMINFAQWCCPYASERFEETNVINWARRHVICPQVIKPSDLAKFKVFTRGNSKDGTTRFKGSMMESFYRMPVRMHAIIILLYAILVTVLCCVDYTVVTPNTIFKCPRGQKLLDYADRTGIIGTMQLPLVFLFAARSNPLTRITGMSYRTFQTFHKWVSRVTFVLLMLHCIFYLQYVQARGDYIQRWGLLKWRMANTAFTALCITTAWGFVRRRYYEWFKLTHKLLLIVFIVGAWYHCITLGWIEYLAISFSIWAADYIWTLAKMVSTGGILKAKCRVIYEKKDSNDGKVIDIPHSIRIEVNHSGWWKPFPGAYCWIYFLRWNMFWQGHPFTVVSTTMQQNFNQLVFIIRVKRGLTKQLAKFISKMPNSQCTIPILVEGPYGTNIPFKAYDHSVFVAGGVGMTIVYSIAMDLAQIYRAQVLRGQKEKTEKSVSLIWMVPNFESIVLFKDEIEKMRQFKEMLRLQIFVTRPVTDPVLKAIIDGGTENGTPQPEYETIENRKDFAPNTLDLETDGGASRQKLEKLELLKDLLKNNGTNNTTIEFNERPDLTTTLQGIYTLKGPTAIIACGPSTLNADIRVVTVECLRRHKSVEYFEQELLW